MRRSDSHSTQSPFATQLDAISTIERSANVAGSITNWWEYGGEDLSEVEQEPPVVFIHGFRGDHHGLEPIVAQLPERHIYMPDLPGFGRSERLSSQGLEGYVEWLRELISTLGLRKFVLLGHSFGSIIAAAAVASGAVAPERLILVNPIGAPALAGPRGVLTRLAVFYYWLAAKLPEQSGLRLLRTKLIVRTMSVTMAKTRDKSKLAWIHREHDAYFAPVSDRDGVLEAFQTSISHDVSEFAERISIPVALIVGTKDDITPLPMQRVLAAKFPNANLYVIPDVGHLIHYETPAIAATHIREFESTEIQ